MNPFLVEVNGIHRVFHKQQIYFDRRITKHETSMNKEAPQSKHLIQESSEQLPPTEGTQNRPERLKRKPYWLNDYVLGTHQRNSFKTVIEQDKTD